MTIQEPVDEPIQQPTQRDALDSMTVGEGAGRVFSPDGLLNQAFDGKGTPESRASAWGGIQTWSDRTSWMWSDPELSGLKGRMETAIDFRKKRSERGALRGAYERGDDLEIGAHQWFMSALRDTNYVPAFNPEAIATSNGRDELMRLRDAVLGAPRDARVRFSTVDGIRQVTMLDAAGNELLRTAHPQYTLNPFDTNPAEVEDPKGAGVMNKIVDVSRGILAGLPYVGEELDAQVAQARNWMHEAGIRPTFGVGRNLFDDEGRINGELTGEDPTAGLIDWATGGGGGFYVEPELAGRFAVVDSPAAYHATSFLFEDVHEDESGQPYVEQQPFVNPVTGDPDPGGRMDLYDFRPGNTVDVALPGGGTTRLDFDKMGGVSNAIAGGKVGVDTIIGHFYYSKDDVVQTPVGKMLVPKLTGNKLVDRELMKDPRMLRSLLHADEKYGDSFWTHMSQEMVGLGEFVLNVKLGKFALRGAGAAAAKLTRPMAARLAGRGGLMSLAGRTAGAWGKVIAPGSKRVAPGSVLSFDAGMVSWMVYHEGMRGMLTGEGTPEDWVQRGVAGGVSFWAFGAMSSALGRAAQSLIGRGMGIRAVEGGRRAALAEGIRAFGQVDPAGRTAKGVASAMEAVKANPQLRRMHGKIEQLVDENLRGVLRGEMNTMAFKHSMHAFSTGAFMGSYGEAQRMAMMDLGPEAAAELSPVDLVAKGYWGDAWASGSWMASAIAFGGLAAGEYATSRAFSKAKTGDSIKRMLSKEQEDWVKEVNELVLFNLDMIARDPQSAIPIMELFSGEMTHDAVDRYVKDALGADPIARDLDAPEMVPGSLNYLSGLAERRGGPELIEGLLYGMEPVELAQLMEQGHGAKLTPDGNIGEMRAARGVLKQVESELMRREKGGEVAPTVKPDRGERAKPEKVPEEEWAGYFRPVEQAFLGGRKRERHQVRGRSTAVVEARDPETGEATYVIVDARRQKAEDGSLELKVPKEYPFSPEGLHQAMGDALRVSRVLKADRSTMKALRKLKEETPEVREEPTEMKPEMKPESQELLSDLREAEFERQEQHAEQARKTAAHVEARAKAEEAKPKPKRKPEVKEPLKEPDPTPERPENLQAQMDAMVAGRKPAVLITPGETTPTIPKGYRSVKVPRGTLIVPKGVVGDALVRQASSDRTLGLALGYGRGERPPSNQIVTARDAKGRVVADIVSPPNWRVVSAARKLAGPGGEVELRHAEAALAERMGLASPLSLAPPPIGSRPPTAQELGAAQTAVGEALEGRRGFGGLNQQERAAKWLRDRDTVSIEGLEARVIQARVSPPPPLVPKAARPSQPSRTPRAVELDAELLEGMRQTGGDPTRLQEAQDALRTARQGAVAQGRAKQAEEARQGDGARSELWDGELVDPITGAKSSRRGLFRIGAEFFSGGARTEVARADRLAVIFATVQSKVIRQQLEAKLAGTQDPVAVASLQARIKLEADRTDSIVGGMLVATGLTPPSSGKVTGFQPVIARLTGLSRGQVEAVRQRLINEGRVFDPLIREAVDAIRDSRGRPVISRQQLHRESPRGSGQQPTFDVLRVAALAPPVAMRAGRGRLFQGGKGRGSLAEGFERFISEERIEHGLEGEAPLVVPPGQQILAQALIAGGAKPELAAKVSITALNGRVGEIGKVKTGQRNLTDMAGSLEARIAHSMLGDHRARSDTKIETLEGSPTVSEVAQQLMEVISGRGVERTGISVSATGEVDVASLAVQSASARRAIEVSEANPDANVELYHEMGGQTRELLLELMDLRISVPDVPGGVWVLPRGTGDAASFVGTPARSMQATNLLRRLSLRDPALLELFKNSTEPDGTPTYANPEGIFEIAAARAKKIVAGNQHLLVSMTLESFDAKSAEQVRAILEALEFSANDRAIPDHLMGVLAEGTKVFPNGALDARGVGIDGFVAELLPEKLFHWINERSVELGTPRSNEVVPLCCGMYPALTGWSPITKTYKPVRVEGIALRKAMLGTRDPNAGLAPLIGRGRFADFVQKGGGPFGDGRGGLNALGKASSAMLSGWYRNIGRALRSQTAPTEVRAKALALRRSLVATEHMRDMAFEEMGLWRKRAAQMQMTSGEANLIGKLMMSGAVRRFQTKEQWVKVFGDRRSHLFDRLMELSDIARRLGQWGYEVGMWDRETARNMHDRYFPVLDKMFSDRAIPLKERADTGLDITMAGSARERSRSGDDLNAQAHNLIFDARYAFPLAVWQEATWARVWDAAGQMIESGVVVSAAEHAALPEGSRLWYRKVAEPFGGKAARDPQTWRRMDPGTLEAPGGEAIRQRRLHAKVEQTKAHDFLTAARERAKTEEARTGRPMPEQRRKVLEALEEGYWSDPASLEFDLMLDQADPSLNTGAFGDLVQKVSLQWRKLKTIQNPKHWALNFTSSILTNHINDKVDLFDFIRSATTGQGLYAEGARDLLKWHDWVRAGRPKLDPSDPSTLGIERADRIGGEMGGGTLIRTAFGMENARELFDTMFTPDAEAAFEGTDGGGKTELVRQAAGVMRRRGQFQKGFDERFATIMGTPDPRAHAAAIGELNEIYYLHEMLFKYTAALAGGRHRGMSEADAAIWAAEGTGDYLDRNVNLYRLTTNHAAGITNRERRGRAALGKKPELGAGERFMRMGLGSPFWMYQASMYPTLGRSMIDRPVRTAATYALMSALVQGVDELTGGDRAEMLEAMSGRRDYLSSALTPEVQKEMARRYGDNPVPDFGGGLWPQRPSIRDWVTSWAGILKGPSAFQAPGFAGSKIDFSTTLFPGIGEISGTARTLANLGKERPASDIEGLGDVLGVGFVPSAVMGTTLNLWDMAVGVRGQTRKETWLKSWSNILDETMAVAGPAPLLSQLGRRGILAVDGRTLTDIARGQPGAAIPFSERMGELATSAVVPTHRVLAQSVEREQLTFAEETLRHLGARTRKRPSSDPDVRQGEEINRAMNSAVRQGIVNSYRRYLEHDNAMPMQVLVNQAMDLRPDIGGFENARTLAPQPRTEMGRFIQRFSRSNQEASRMVSRWEEVSLERFDALQNLAVNMAAKRRVHPAVFERMVDGIMRGENSRAGVLGWLHEVTRTERPEWAAEHSSLWVEMWDAADLVEADFAGSSTSRKRWRSVAEWVQKNAPLFDPNHRPPMDFPSVYDAPGGLGTRRLSPRRAAAPPNIQRILGNNQ